MKSIRLFPWFGIIALCTMAGCSSRESKIVGIWVKEGSNTTGECIEFFSDKTISSPGWDSTLSGTWTVLSDGRIKADFSDDGKHYIDLGELKGNILIWEGARFVKQPPGFVKPTPLYVMKKVTRIGIAVLSSAINLYEIDTGRYPWSLNSLIQNDDEVSNWSGPYIKGKIPMDAWGAQYLYTQDAGGYKIVSAGPDMKPGTDDDITHYSYLPDPL